MIWLYRVLLNLAIPFGLIGLMLRGFKNPQYWSRWSERFGFANSNVKSAAPFDLWIHAVSVGEARAAATLIKRLLQERPDCNILVTTTTPTGSAMVGMMLRDTVSHCYFPNMIEAVRRSGSKLIYTNVRLSERSYLSYAKFPKLVKRTLDMVDHFAVQGTLDRKHLELLGVASDKISETGSIKFDVSIPPSLRESAEVMRRQLGQDRLIWIAGSTREGEEGSALITWRVKFNVEVYNVFAAPIMYWKSIAVLMCFWATPWASYR